jgi:hypothetical protein
MTGRPGVPRLALCLALSAAVLLGSAATSATSWRLGVLDGLVYIPSAGAVEVVDLGDPSNPAHVSWMRPELPFDPRAVVFGNGAAFIGTNAHVFLAKPQCTASATAARMGVPRAGSVLVSPKPFDDRTRLSFTLASPGRVRLDVYDVRGRLVRTLLDAHRTGGTQHVSWDGRLPNGAPGASGVYFYRLEAGGASVTGKIVRATR